MNSKLDWVRSSYSGSESGNCIEVANTSHGVHVRDSKDLTIPSLRISPAAWSDFLKYTEA
ncbi:DUF397 domain-containing protein [Streptomyces sp. DT20]|uniref:DUF397 domain-containing protein n=1 Tax=Streptomyces sp. DT20 TaxID=3416519 RepID=UPI003CE8F1F2